MSTAAWFWAYDADEPEWITANGAHVPLNGSGQLAGAVGRKLKEAAQKKDEIFGEAFTAYAGKPADAIEHLLREKRGHVPGAFHKKGLGDIDLPYGKTGKGGFGLAHIIERRNAQGFDGEAFVRELPKLIEEGRVEYRREYKNRAYIVHEGKEAVVRLDWDGKDRKWLVSAYFQDENNALGSDCRTDLNQTCVDRKATQPNSRHLLKKEYPQPQAKAMKKRHAFTVALDRASARTTDENGFLHVAASHITKAAVNPYYGREIPGAEDAGLDPDRIYYGLRDPEELKKSLPTWAGLPLHVEHHIDSAEEPQKLTRVGTVGTEIVWNAPYVDAPLTVWDKTAIDGIKDNSFRELSCAYRYDPDFTPGRYEGQPYDFVMRNIRGNHVALVEEGRAGPDVLVADAAPKGANTNPYMEKVIMKLRGLFRGAKDIDPATEQKEVDLAQAIIDLHRVDPLTGEVKDVAEDDDKVAELRVLVESLKDKLPPEDLKRLTDAVAAMAVAEAAGDEEPERKEGPAMDADEMDAMKKAGCDAEDPDEARAFAEGVKYGEELEKNPAERAKLDREHESEGMKKAMDGCGLDAENPAEAKAFAEGVKYGEEKERTEREKLDKEHESEGMKAAEDEDKNAMIDKIIAAVPGLTPEQVKKMRDTLADLAYAPATGDEDVEKKVEAATDSALKRRRFLGATDAARIRAQATSDAMRTLRDITEAVRRVRPLVGEMDAMSFDSAAQVYGETLKQLGKNPAAYDRRAWRGMVDMLLDEHAAARTAHVALAADSRALPDKGPFSHLQDIRLG